MVALITAAALPLAVVPLARDASTPTFAAPRRVEHWPLAAGREREERAAALARADVWQPTDPATADVRSNPPDPTGMLSEPIVRCRFLAAAARGTTPKFDCVLRDGEVVKVKYGSLTGEIHAEVAASRLLTALGFGADRMYLVRRVRCYGCPRFPFQLARVLGPLAGGDALASWLPDDRFVDFEWAAVERRFDGREIVSGTDEGWAWYELDDLKRAPAARRADVDGLRVMAMFLAHWDNKASNQRLVCRADSHSRASVGPPSLAYASFGETGTSTCPHPFALIHDLGATFGPNKVDLTGWRATPIWADRARCRISMHGLPYDGGTFRDVEISEAGRQLIARQLTALGDRQVRDLFDAARFDEFHTWNSRSRPVDAWVAAFRAKVDEITSAGPCPQSAAAP